MSKTYLNIFYFIYIFILGLFIFLLINLFGNIQFTGMDGGVLVNSAYMGFLDYRPYQDFITAVPPAFLIGGKLAMLIFGLYWNSLVIMSALYAVITFIILAIILNKIGFSKPWSLLIAFYCESVVMIMKSFWYYNEITIITGLLFISAAFLLYQKHRSFFNQLIFVILTTMVLLMKINIAAPLVFFIYMFFLINNKIPKKLSAVLLFMSVLLLLIILGLFKINIVDLINNYLQSSSRTFSIHAWKYNLFIGFPWEVKETFIITIPILLVFLFILIDSWKIKLFKQKNLSAICFSSISILIGLIALGTNNDVNLVDETFVILGASFFIWFWKDKTQNKVLRTIALSCLAGTMVFFSLLGIYKGMTRISLQETSIDLAKEGNAYFYDGSSSVRPLSKLTGYNFFKTLDGSQKLKKTLQQISFVINNISDKKSQLKEAILFGPRIDFAYAVYSVKPPKGLPLWWEAYSDDSQEATKKMVRAFEDKKIKVGIYVNDNDGYSFPFYPSELINYFTNQYDVYYFSELKVYVLKNDQTLDVLRQSLKKFN
ncbi:MAG: hypothetical protein US40_C0001G0064 [Candidatus Roizmanbacteria bacterium GW2011_GWC2_37_13]|uniref:Glycosyltransferase RgtA/B/C/D-like domain-containing protein n=1 Tax=Candidatus Roizmanbacteria bacterium GW2011_GWC2_37_13 TaxID=1618486 RepID=A0A0G0GKQ2_9BACT|nr:MAG: hypothetical protein US38_C0002G0064 [Candidatus Roizmanbacteria bacterium GW2011_GWC1_37_12]KKQ26715.1 MAG: hypothetical protein US40_C0001G0064 [Candidatus Roizmanbacteria bacterium GW2011_GWC2_37_13]